jgi:hypothetical protein
MKIHFPGLLRATISSFLIFILIDATFEFILFKSAGISFLNCFEQTNHRQYNIQFYIFNFILFALEMFLVMLSYAVLRPLFNSKAKPIALCAFFFISFVFLFLMQLVNLGIYPLKPALIFGISTLIGFPAAVFAGALKYERFYLKMLNSTTSEKYPLESFNE